MKLNFDIKDDYVNSCREAYANYVLMATSNDKVKAKKAEATYNQALKTVLSQINEQLEDKLIDVEEGVIEE